MAQQPAQNAASITALQGSLPQAHATAGLGSKLAAQLPLRLAGALHRSSRAASIGSIGSAGSAGSSSTMVSPPTDLPASDSEQDEPQPGGMQTVLLRSQR